MAHLGSRQFLYWFASLSELVCFLSGLRGFAVSHLSLTMDPKLKALLNPEDEVIWRQAGLFESVDNFQKESSGGAPFSKQNPSTLISTTGKTSLLSSLQPASLKTVPNPSENCRASFQATSEPTGLPFSAENALGGIKK